MWSARAPADRILTVSEASKRDILRFFDIAPEKIEVIYNAIDERSSATPPAEEDIARVRERYQLDHPFVLYVGNIKPHKNLERLIEAFGRRAPRRASTPEAAHHRRRDLEVPGAAARGAPHKLHKHVRFLGFQPDETLAVLYRLAGVFVFPSLYEGSACRRSRRWPAARRWSPRTCRRCRRSPATPRAGRPLRPDAIADGMRRCSPTRAARRPARRGSRGPASSRGTRSVADPPRSTGGGAAARVSARAAPARPSPPAMIPPRRARPRLADRHARRREGARRLCELFPTPTSSRSSTCRARCRPPSNGAAVRTSFVQRLPGAGRLYRHYLPLFPPPSSSSTSTGTTWSSAAATARPSRWSCARRARATSATATRRCATPGTSSTPTSGRRGGPGQPPCCGR
jgi:hypothetical protein